MADSPHCRSLTSGRKKLARSQNVTYWGRSFGVLQVLDNQTGRYGPIPHRVAHQQNYTMFWSAKQRHIVPRRRPQIMTLKSACKNELYAHF